MHARNQSINNHFLLEQSFFRNKYLATIESHHIVSNQTKIYIDIYTANYTLCYTFIKMNCLFNTPLSAFRFRHKHKKNDNQHNFSTTTNNGIDPKLQKNQSPIIIQNNNEKGHDHQIIKNNLTDTTNSNSQSHSTNTKTTSAMNSIPSGVPFEISVGGPSFDACDEVSVISFSTLRPPSTSFEYTKKKNRKQGKKKNDFNYSSANSGGSNTVNMNQKKQQLQAIHHVKNGTRCNRGQNSLRKRESRNGDNDGNGSDENDIETTSQYTRISI